jgi:hypothetical protein
MGRQHDARDIAAVTVVRHSAPLDDAVAKTLGAEHGERGKIRLLKDFFSLFPDIFLAHVSFGWQPQASEYLANDPSRAPVSRAAAPGKRIEVAVMPFFRIIAIN